MSCTERSTVVVEHRSAAGEKRLRLSTQKRQDRIIYIGHITDHCQLPAAERTRAKEGYARRSQ